MNIRTYTELIQLPTFEERFDYVKLNGSVGSETFGCDRYFYQRFLKSAEWKRIRNQVIIRDEARDLAIPGREIFSNTKILIHHLNPVTKEDLIHGSDFLLNPEYMVCVSEETHNAIHYGDMNLLVGDYVERTPNDTCPWKNL